MDLFGKMIGGKVTGIRLFENERSFAILLSDNQLLLFKMHGIRSNILLYEHETVMELFRNNIAADETLMYETLDRTIDWSYEAFLAEHKKLASLYFTFGKPVWKYLEQQNFQSLSIEEQWQEIQVVRKQLEASRFYISVLDNNFVLSLLPVGQIQKEFTDPIKALNEFFYVYTAQNALVRERASALSAVRQKILGAENYYQKTFGKLAEVEQDNHYKVWADVLMANLHQVQQGVSKITLENFYDNNQPIEIKLRQDSSPQKNAESYYRKAKNQHIEIQRLQQALEAKEKELSRLQQQLAILEQTEDLKSLRKLTSEQGHQKKEKQDAPVPYHEMEFNGFRILVGKNAQSNDIVTFKFSYKDDLWLHAKDVTGSHVLIKHQANKPFPKDVIEYAAQLAAYNSKRKTETLCPVVVTPKKYVRKRKGDPAGAVVVEREDVILVEPLRNV